MFSFRKILVKAIGISLITAACVEPISFESNPAGNQLIVNGKITNADGPYEVLLNKTAQNAPFPVPMSGAQVTLYNERGQQDLFLEQESGLYRTGKLIQGQPGDTYYIEIVLADGTTYRSLPETMPGAIGQDSAYYEVVKEEVVSESGILFEDRVVKVYTDTQLPAEASSLYLKWEVQSVYSVTTKVSSPLGDQIVYCYFYEYPNAQDILLFNRQALSEGNKLQRQWVATREVDYSFLERHYFNVIQSSITRRAYDYWDQVRQLSNRTGSIFDTPPGLAKGNVYNVDDAEEQVLGYFEAALVDTARFFLNRRNIPFNIGSTCQCNQCYELPDFTYDRPGYF